MRIQRAVGPLTGRVSGLELLLVRQEEKESTQTDSAYASDILFLS